MDSEKAQKYIHSLLHHMVQNYGSDMFLTAGYPPAMKVDGKLTKIGPQALTPNHTQALAHVLMTERQRTEFAKTKECNFAINPETIGRFRVNAFVQQGHVGMVLRVIASTPPSFTDLGLPEVLKHLVLSKRGLCMVIGATGSGKSSTLAAMLDWRNQETYGHIVTVEDPIEFTHPHKNCVITQREIGLDTESWDQALKNAMRQSPDVIMMGEIRDRESMQLALRFADTGHLCLATMHANTSAQALETVVNYFPEERREQLLMDLSSNLRGVVAQQLVPRATGKGRCAAIEILINSPLISEIISKGEFSRVKEVQKKSQNQGMKTFNQALFDLYESGYITYDDALRYADSVNDLRLAIKLNSQRAKKEEASGGGRTSEFSIDNQY